MLVPLTLLVTAFVALATPPDVPVGFFMYYDELGGKPYNATNDERSFIINGQRTILLGGSVHYPRFSVGQWPDVLRKAREDGLNHVEVYVFWNLHEFTYDFSGNHVYNWEGRANIAAFLDECAKAGLFVNLRIGPYVCAEWDFGGLPVWLLHVDGIIFRGDNQQWEDAMSTWMNDLSPIIEPYLAKNGGPIVLAQIENEYEGSMTYVDWCGDYAMSLDYEVPWVMCNGESAPQTVNTCNGNNCYSYAQAHGSKFPGQPLGWTENEGWFQDWSASYDPNNAGWANRSPENMAYSVAIWFGAGGAHHNYYMWMGGNHISHWAGSSIANYYADGVNYHADGLVHEPKRTHLYRLHKIIADNQIALLSTDAQIGNEIPITPVGQNASMALYVSQCDINGLVTQQWTFDSSSGLLSTTATDGSKLCVSATGDSNPVPLYPCDSSDSHQKWTYNNLQFISQYSGKCLDIYSESGPSVDEWTCKDPSSSDAANQEWTFSGNLLKSKYNTNECLTAEVSIGTFAYVYTGPSYVDKVTFLVNMQPVDYVLPWEGINYNMPSQSVAILDWQNEELYNSAKVDTDGLPTQRVYNTLLTGNKDLQWSSWTEMIPLQNNTQNRNDSPTKNTSPFEQIRFSNESSEYLFYSTQFKLNSALNSGTLQFAGREANAYLVYIDSDFQSEVYDYSHGRGGKTFKASLTTNLKASVTYTLTILSSSLGIDNGIANQQGANSQDKKGLVGGVTLMNGNTNVMTLTSNSWLHWIGSTGENLQVFGSGMNNVQWTSPIVTSNTKTWYKTSFSIDASVFEEGVILVDIGNSNGLKRGHFYLNGINMGHYNNVIVSGLMVQRYYFIPNDMLNTGSTTNTLLFEEELGSVDPTNVNIVVSNVVIPSN